MWSAPVLVTPPAAEPVSLAEAKEFLGIDLLERDEDEQLARFIAAARAQAEAQTGTRLMPQTVALFADAWADLARLPIGPVRAVTAIEWQPGEGPAQSLAPAAYELTGAGLARGIRPSLSARTFPPGLDRRGGAIRVTLELGYEPLPEPLHLAVLIMVADLVMQRESFVVGTVAGRVPSSMQLDALLGNYRIWL